MSSILGIITESGNHLLKSTPKLGPETNCGPSARPPTGIVFLALCLAACTDQKSGYAGPAQATPPQVSVVALHPQSVAITVELPGRTAASLIADVRPQVSGIIRSRMFTEGGEVKAGDLLYQIDSASYQASFDSAVAQLAQAQAAIPSAQTKVDRYQGLVRQNAVAKQDLDDATATLAADKAAVAIEQAAVEAARINLQFTNIGAPIGGRIDASVVTPGALVTASQDTALTTIRQLDPINVTVTQSITNLLNLKQAIHDGHIKISGADVKVKLLLDNGAIYGQEGRLEFAEANVSETTGTFNLRAVFPNPDRTLLPGMFVRAVVEQGIAQNSFLIPQRAVTHDAKGQAVALFVGGDDKLESRTLDIRQNVGSSWLTSSGVRDGDRVVVEGSQLVRPGQQVTAVEVTIDPSTGNIVAPKQNPSSSALGAGSQG